MSGAGRGITFRGLLVNSIIQERPCRPPPEAMKNALTKEIYPMTLDQNAPNPYAARATWDDVRNSVKPVIDDVTQKIKRGSDALMMELEPLHK